MGANRTGWPPPGTDERLPTFGLRLDASGELSLMTEREQYGKLADELEDRADALASESEQLGERIADVRDDWRRKRADAGVPGATPDWDDPDEDEDDDDSDDDEDEDDGEDEDD